MREMGMETKSALNTRGHVEVAEELLNADAERHA